MDEDQLRRYWNSGEFLMAHISFDSLSDEFKQHLANTLGFACFRMKEAADAMIQAIREAV